MEGFEKDVFERWGESMAGGYQVIPNQLLRLQQKLGLSSHQIVILLNLSMHWWRKKDLPFVGASLIAKRMGISRRTVERQLKDLYDRGLVERKPLPEAVSGYEDTIGYDLSGLVAELATLTPAEAKSSKLALRIQELRADRAEAEAREKRARRKSASSSELRG